MSPPFSNSNQLTMRFCDDLIFFLIFFTTSKIILKIFLFLLLFFKFPQAVCAELDSSKEENSRLLGRIKELEMQIKEKDEKAKQNLQKLLNDIHVMSNN